MYQKIDDVPKIVFKPHGGNVDTTLQVFFKDQQNFDESLQNEDYKSPKNSALWNFFGLAVFPVGATAGLHKHMGNDEIMYVLEGRAEIVVDGNKFVMEPGVAILTKDGSEHYIENVTKELKFLTLEILTLESVTK